MTSWKKVSLSELGELSRGKSKHRPRNDPSLYGGDFPFIQTGDVKEASFYINNYSQTYNEKGLKQSKLWEKNTLCITIAANIAESALLNFPACFPDSIVGFLPYDQVSDVRFVKYLLDNYKSEFQKRSKGATQDNLSVSKLNSLKVKAPNYTYQAKVANVISAYDELIENNQKRISILEEMAQRLYTEWFVNYRYPGHEDVKLVNSGTEYGMIPESWKLEKLGAILKKVFSGGTPNTRSESFWNGEHRWLSSGETRNKFIAHTEKTITQEGVDGSSTKLARASDIVIASAGQGKTRGRVSYLKNDMYVNQSLICLRCSDQLPISRFLFCNLSKRYEELRNLSQTSSTRGSLTTKIVKGLKIALPSKEIASKFEHKVEIIFDQIFVIQDVNTELTEMRDLLIENLITGKRLLKN